MIHIKFHGSLDLLLVKPGSEYQEKYLGLARRASLLASISLASENSREIEG